MPTNVSSPADYGGARGSNAGDQFHELWALLQALKLLKPNTSGLGGVAVEGIGPESAPINEDAEPHRWEGVDVALFYGGPTMETADRIELAQLKYSASNPEGKWTVSRLCSSTKQSGNNSVIRRLANDFKNARARAKASTSIASQLISNQAAADDIRDVIQYETAPSEWEERRRIEHKANVAAVRKASGLDKTAFTAFLQALNVEGCGTVSRHAIGLAVVKAIATVLGDDVLSETSELRTKVRDLMLPDAHRIVVDEDVLLSWFGVQDKIGLFPAPSAIVPIADPIHRVGADEIARYFNSGERIVILHGDGGSGKTTLSQQVLGLLPPGSVQVTFDCFGGGAYMYAGDKRHRAEKAFLQLCNDLAVATDCPIFIPRSGSQPATIDVFLSRLSLAAQTLAETQPSAMLLVIVDAADNAVTAATSARPPERPFVWDIADLAPGKLPANVRILLSSRTGRKDSLQFPSNTREVVCDRFTLPESASHLRRVFPGASDDAASQFHKLTSENPRVQAYALSAPGQSIDTLFQTLLPNGRTLPDVLEALFKDALEKLGQKDIFDKLTAALAVLPAPASIDAIAAVSGCTAPIVTDFALDLRKGLTVSDGGMTVADEDFEKYINDRSAKHQAATVADAAAHFWATYKTAPYSAAHVVAFLIRAKREKDVFEVLDHDPNVDAVQDAVIKREIQNSRLALALASCRQSGDLANELKTVLLGATARRDEGAFYEVIDKEIDLAAEFSHPTVYRRLLIDRDRVHHQGSALAHSALAAARKQDRTTAIQYLRRYENWMDALKSARKHKGDEKWKVTDEDIAALIETNVRVAGVRRAYRELNRWRPIQIRLRVTQMILPRLIIGGFGSDLLEALASGVFRTPFALAVAVPLQQAGISVSKEIWTKCFQSLRSVHIPHLDGIGNERSKATNAAWTQTLLTACEIGVWNGLPKKVLRPVLIKIETALARKTRTAVTLSNSVRLDALARVWLLRQMIDRKEGSADAFLKFVGRIGPKSPAKRSKAARRNRTGDDRDRQTSRLRTLHGVYQGRLSLFGAALASSSGKKSTSTSIPSGAYDFDSGYESVGLRLGMACSITSLVFVQALEPASLLERATSILERRYQPESDAPPNLSVLAPLFLRAHFHPQLVDVISKAAQQVFAETTRANEKVSTLVDYARCLLPISWHDAQTLFTAALNIAKDIDEEAVDQIGFVMALGPVARPDPNDPDPANAHRLATFGAGAALRLYGSDLFDWAELVMALTTLDGPTALASICRWSDEGEAQLAITTPSFIRTAIARNLIGQGIATAVAQTGVGLTSELLRTLGNYLHANQGASQTALCEEVSRIILTENGQSARVERGKLFLELVGRDEVGPYTQLLKATVDFAPAADRSDNVRETSGMPLPETGPKNVPKSTPYHLSQFKQGSTDLNEVIREARKAEEYLSAASLLEELGHKHVGVSDRVDFLTAVTEINPEVASANEWGDAIERLLGAWSTVSVGEWARQTLPEVLSKHLGAFARWLPYREGMLEQLLQRCSSDRSQQIEILLKGISHSGTTMESKVLFALAKRIAPGLSQEQARHVLDWYLRRLEERVPVNDRNALKPRDVPLTMREALGRYFFSLFSDIDTRIRWGAGHAIRLLARVGETDIVTSIYENFDRKKDHAFRTPDGEFYWLAAQLWTCLVAYRISFEAPQALANSHASLLKAALSTELPHAAIREAAKRALQQLQEVGVAALDQATLTELAGINVATKRKKPTRQYKPSASFDRTRQRNSRRFNFDEMDTIPYWYNALLHIFPDVPQERILAIAESWIIDKWGASNDERYKAAKARKSRLRDSDYGLTSHSHGGLPTLEEYGTYLEWHAMLCVAGQLIASETIGAQEEGVDRFDDWLRRFLPTLAPQWLADLRGPTPLESQLWGPDPKKDTQWLREGSLADAMERARLSNTDGWIVVGGRTEYQSQTRREEVSIQTALVSRDTADSLVRNFQTVEQRWDIYLPSDTDESIDRAPFSLQGWLGAGHGDTQLDEKDARRYDVRRQELRPGSAVSRHFGLKRQFSTSGVDYVSGDAALFRYRAWDDEPPRDTRYIEASSASSGWRLAVREEALAEYLALGEMCLICEMIVERRVHKSYSGPYDESSRKKEYWKVVTFTPDGKIRDGARDIGTWKKARRRTATGRPA